MALLAPNARRQPSLLNELLHVGLLARFMDLYNFVNSLNNPGPSVETVDNTISTIAYEW